MATTYSDYPKSARKHAKRATEINKEFGTPCATNVGKNRAADLIAGRGFSYDVVKRIYSYLSRGYAYVTGDYLNDKGKPVCGDISFALWGGNIKVTSLDQDPMYKWCKRIIDKVEQENMKDVYIYDSIDDVNGISAQDVINELDGAEDIMLHINSGGGMVFDGLAIYNALKNHKGEVTAVIEGLSASISSVIMLGADKVVMANNSFIMIHNPKMGVFGEATDIEAKLELMNKTKDQIIDIYNAKTGIDKEELSNMMDKETWLNANEALEMGFVDELTEGVKIAACLNGLEIAGVNHVPIKLQNQITKIEMEEIRKMIDGLMTAIDTLATPKTEEAVADNVENTEDVIEVTKNDIVNLAEKVGEVEEKVDNNESLVNELDELKMIVETLTNEKEDALAELNKMKATKTPTDSEKEPSIVADKKDVNPWNNIANELSDNSIFNINKK